MKVKAHYESIPFPVALDVGFCFYEKSLATVKRAIESVKDHVRFIYAIDGKFEFFEDWETLSSPEVRDYLSTISNVILFDYANRKEHEKRQQYLILAQEYMSDYLLILDADEWITDETNWTELYAALLRNYEGTILPKIWGVTIRENTDGERRKRDIGFPRLWQRPYLIQYMNTHNFFKFNDGSIYRSSVNFPIMPNIYMRGNDKNRTKEYLDKIYSYQKRLMEYELPIKTELKKVAKNTKVNDETNTFRGIPMV